MTERRVRLGDILDDYCPRERRVTNHAVVAMVEDEVKQTRCTTCDADHEYKHAKVPAPRRKKATAAALASDGPEGPPVVVARNAEPESEPMADVEEASDQGLEPEMAAADAGAENEGPEEERAASDEDDWPVHRRLIRATLPRPEGQTPERREPDFTIRQNDGRGNSNQRNNGNNKRRRNNRQQAWQSLQGLPSGPFTHGSSRSGQGFNRGAGPQGGNSQRQGNRQPDANGNQAGRQGQGGGGQRPGRRGRRRGGR